MDHYQRRVKLLKIPVDMLMDMFSLRQLFYIYNLPIDASVDAVFPEPSTHTIVLVIRSKKFDVVPPGIEPPTVLAKLEPLTREQLKRYYEEWTKDEAR